MRALRGYSLVLGPLLATAQHQGLRSQRVIKVAPGLNVVALLEHRRRPRVEASSGASFRRLSAQLEHPLMPAPMSGRPELADEQPFTGFASRLRDLTRDTRQEPFRIGQVALDRDQPPRLLARARHLGLTAPKPQIAPSIHDLTVEACGDKSLGEAIPMDRWPFVGGLRADQKVSHGRDCRRELPAHAGDPCVREGRHSALFRRNERGHLGAQRGSQREETGALMPGVVCCHVPVGG